MSWFDAAGLASIAKSALKGAQKTIDKALDIKDSDFASAPVNTPVDTNDDFFGTWGLGQAEEKGSGEETRNNVSASLWGSFTGSFFETPKEGSRGLLDEGAVKSERFSQSKLVVQRSEEGATEGQTEVEQKTFSDASPQVVIRKPPEQSSNIHNNRLSVLSESGKTSSESVEILSGDTGCTTSPDSDALSISTPSSAQGTKHTSESVEILPESLTSPSSLEILGSDSNQYSQHSDEFVSPLGSPITEAVVSTPVSKNSPDSVDVIPEDPEDASVAEDTSYTSVSETTSATVLESVFSHLKPQKHLKHEPVSEVSSETTAEPITRAPSKSGMLLPLNIINMQLIDTQPQSGNQNLLSVYKNANIIDIPQESESFGSAMSEIQLEAKDDEGFQSDRTMIASDTVMESSSDTSTIEGNSSYVKTMLADAMTEKSLSDLGQDMNDSTHSIDNISLTQLEMPPREPSPLSSESLIKIGSGHTSGDEMETNTSSDIEIISSPNGDSSSTQSRQSPAKQCSLKSKSGDPNVDVLLGKMTFKKIKGHNRELSEASSISDDSHSSEVDRLLKRVSEMTEILELREAKLIEMNRRNAELHEQNTELQKQLDGFLTKQNESADLSQVTEEYTQRLSALEKKFQQAIRDKDSLRKQLEQCKQESAVRISKSEMSAMMDEKEETIRQLREEGEKLSKQQLQHSNIIKKLRAKEKEQEAAIKNLKETVEELSSETERLKRSLTAKDEVERTQIEAIHQLTAKNKKMENEVNQLQGQLDDLTQKYDTLKKSHDAAKKELIDKNKASSELLAREQLLETLENEKNLVESQKEQIMNQLDNLRLKLHEADQEYLKKEQSLRAENTELLRRLEDAERRNEELAQSVLEVSKPLVRQLETLQSTHNKKVAIFEKTEQSLTGKISELQNRLKLMTENENLSRNECTDLQRKLSSLEQQLNSAHREIEAVNVELQKRTMENMVLEHDLKREINNLQHELNAKKEECQNLTTQLNTLQHQLQQEQSLYESELQKNTPIQQDQSPLEKTDPSPATRNTSPTLSLGKTSLSESLGSAFWSPEEPFDAAPAPRYTNIFEMQMLQTNLKQREGELQQLQWEANRREQERVLLNSQIGTLLSRVEELESKLKENEGLKGQFEELQRQYDTLCLLFGEKVEENEELKLDLQDVKEMYKTQIDELLGKQKQKD